MNYPPMVMRLKIKQQDKRVNLWLPLFILAPIGVVLATVFVVILLPFVLIWALVTGRVRLWRPIICLWPVAVGCLLALRGLEVDVKSKKETVLVSFK
jgi:hypothetical protein